MNGGNKVKRALISCAIIVTLLTVVGFTNASATYEFFQGSAGFSAAKVGDANPKQNYEYLSGVQWDYSDHSGHKMWFRIKNSNKENRGSILINRPAEGVKNYLETDCKFGYNYYLYANREHWGNPSTFVRGYWQP